MIDEQEKGCVLETSFPQKTGEFGKIKLVLFIVFVFPLSGFSPRQGFFILGNDQNFNCKRLFFEK